MALHTENMSNVQAPGDLKPEGWYHVRVAKVTEKESSTGNPIVELHLKINQPESMVGQMLFDRPSLQAHALFSLKAYYKAMNYNPGPEGHDPEKLLDAEFWVFNEHSKGADDVVRDSIPAYSIRSVTAGPGTKKPKAS